MHWYLVATVHREYPVPVLYSRPGYRLGESIIQPLERLSDFWLAVRVSDPIWSACLTFFTNVKQYDALGNVGCIASMLMSIEKDPTQASSSLVVLHKHDTHRVSSSRPVEEGTITVRPSELITFSRIVIAEWILHAVAYHWSSRSQLEVVRAVLALGLLCTAESVTRTRVTSYETHNIFFN